MHQPFQSRARRVPGARAVSPDARGRAANSSPPLLRCSAALRASSALLLLRTPLKMAGVNTALSDDLLRHIFAQSLDDRSLCRSAKVLSLIHI